MRGRWVGPAMVMAAILALGGCELETSSLSPSAEEDSPSAKAKPRKKVTRGEVSVPLDVITSSRATLVLVPVRVNGRGPYDFILDTGASTSTVDRRLVRKLGLPKTGETSRVTGVTGSAEVPVVRLRGWTLGGEPLRGRELTVTDLGDPRIAGLLGSDELRRFGAVTVNFERERLVLRDK